MSAAAAVEALRAALLLALTLALPLLVALAATALLVAALQALTQLRERTLATVPRLIVGLLVLALTTSWMAGRLGGYLRATLERIAIVGRS